MSDSTEMSTTDDDTLSKQIDAIMKEAWSLYRKLGGSYDSMWDQVSDMRRLGRLGEAAQRLSDTRHALRIARGHYSSGLESS